MDHHFYIPLKLIKLWNWIHGCEKRESSRSGNQNRGRLSSDKAVRGRMTKHLSLSVTILSSEWHQLNGAEKQRVIQGQKKRERQTGGAQVRKQKKWKTIERARMTVKRKRKTEQQFPADIVWPVIAQKRKNLSYVSAFDIASTIYVPARIKQLDSSVEKKAINLILFRFFSPLFFFFPSPANPLRLCSFAFICSGLFPVLLGASMKQQAFVSCKHCILLSLSSL